MSLFHFFWVSYAAALNARLRLVTTSSSTTHTAGKKSEDFSKGDKLSFSDLRYRPRYRQNRCRSGGDTQKRWWLYRLGTGKVPIGTSCTVSSSKCFTNQSVVVCNCTGMWIDRQACPTCLVTPQNYKLYRRKLTYMLWKSLIIVKTRKTAVVGEGTIQVLLTSSTWEIKPPRLSLPRWRTPQRWCNLDLIRSRYPWWLRWVETGAVQATSTQRSFDRCFYRKHTARHNACLHSVNFVDDLPHNE